MARPWYLDLTEPYKQYRRLYPKIRIAYTLYTAYVRKDWDAVAAYLTEMGMFRSDAMETGIVVHDFLEQNEVQPKILRTINRWSEKREPVYKEIKIELDQDNYMLVAKPDLLIGEFIVEYKTGTTKLEYYKRQLEFYKYVLAKSGMTDYNMGLIARIEPVFKRGELRKTIITEKKVYQLPDVSRWDDVCYELFNYILTKIDEGSLDRYISKFN
jgi:hypothetical protein